MVTPAAAGEQKGGSDMNVAQDMNCGNGFMASPGTAVPVPHQADDRALHRIAEVRRRQGISVRSAARRLSTSMDQVRRQEDPACDMSLSQLYRWQRALEVPVVDLLVDSDAPLSDTVLSRARLLRVMKTVRTIQDATSNTAVQRLATMMEQQLVELMPELKEVSAWPSVGQRRSANELGRAAERVLPESFFTDSGV
jgi:transcriptional regulator with XRE-family HTH domain